MIVRVSINEWLDLRHFAALVDEGDHFKLFIQGTPRPTYLWKNQLWTGAEDSINTYWKEGSHNA